MNRLYRVLTLVVPAPKSECAAWIRSTLDYIGHMKSLPLFRPVFRAVTTACAVAAFSTAASAVDLSVTSMEISQGFQATAGTTTLVAKNVTVVRAKISLNGQTTAQAGVDAVLRIYSNGVEIFGSPVYSHNGPISAPAAPNSLNINDTLNFYCFPPQSTDVDFVLTVNPFRTIVETNTANNTLTVSNKVFVCRKMVDLAYTPVNYTFGAGLPSSSTIEPGNGDAFLRGIYKTGDWNYHRSPLATPVFATDINSTSTNLLNTLEAMRQTTIPAAGYARPDFIYGWLPGNPFSGNGQAIGIPGSAAFGNTETSRFQRTFAHEIGHCWGLSHNTTPIGVVSFDVEAQLRDPLGLAQIMATTKNDIMVAGLLTNEAWVASGSYLDCITDTRSACAAFVGDGTDGTDGGGGASDAFTLDPRATSVLRISGVHDHLLRRVTLDHAMVNELVIETVDDPSGNVLVESFDAAGVSLTTLRVNTRACRESCGNPAHQHQTTSLFVNLPRWIDGREAARVSVREFAKGAAGKPLAQLTRSTNAPTITQFTVAPQIAGPSIFDPARDALVGATTIAWSATDLDGDTLIADLLYSPNGGDAWLPITVGEATGSFSFDSNDLPASIGVQGMFRVRVSDGMNTSEREFEFRLAFGNSQPPDVHVIAPNTTTTFPQGASVILHGSAWDIDDQLLPEGGLAWRSSRDGNLGSGRFLVRRNLTVGAHVITLRGTDSGGLFTERSINLTISARVFNRGDVDGDGIIGATDLAILLSSWNGNGIADLNVDGIIDSIDLAMLLGGWG